MAQGHDYRTRDTVCKRPLSATEAADLLSRYAVPNEFLNGDPVSNGEHLVTNGWGLPGGFVQTTFTANGFAATNVTTPVHVFVGTIVRSIGIVNGSTIINTHGYGNAGSSTIGRFRDENNQEFGPGIFSALDSKAADYAASHIPGC